MTLPRLRDADAERLMDPGAPLLVAVVATPRRVSVSRVCGADRLGTAPGAVVSAIDRDLARGLRWQRKLGDGTTNG